MIGLMGALGACKDARSLDGKSTTARSVPRADWPCAATATRSDGLKVTAAFTYGDLAACWIPIVQHLDGVTGCPTRAVVTAPTGAQTITYRYDAAGHLISADAQTYLWKGDVAVGETRASTTSHYQTPGGTAASLVVASARYRVEGGRLLEKVAGVGNTVLEWNGHRLTGKRAVGGGGGDWVTVFRYDCAAPPP